MGKPLCRAVERQGERELILQIVLPKSLGGRRMQGLGPLQAIAGVLLKLYRIVYNRYVQIDDHKEVCLDGGGGGARWKLHSMGGW